MAVFKYCPKCGSQDFVPDSEKSLKCGFCGCRYFINMNAAVAAIIYNENDEILFTVRKHEPAAGMLDLPGGFVDFGETAEDAVRREIYEELNLEISSIQYLGTFTNSYLFAEIEYHTLDLVFICKVISMNSLEVADDVSGYIFKNISAVRENEIGLESIKKIVRQLKSKAG